MSRRLRVLHPLSAWGRGHIQTCINILKGMVNNGADVHLDLPRSRVDMGDIPYTASTIRPIDRFVVPPLEPYLKLSAERRFLARLRDGDIAWLWPGVSLETFYRVKQRGNPILMEGINTRIASANRIIARAYEMEGLPPPPDRNSEQPEREEEEMLSIASHFFSPSPLVDEAIMADGSSFSGHVIPTSYGAWNRAGPPEPRQADMPITVLSVGTVCIRKNAHGLLRAWADAAPPNARLVLCGDVEPAVAALCAHELSLPSVIVRGHVDEIDSAYREADVFIMPSLEEGGPQVTYEAAVFGLPVIASPMGGGRMAETTDAVYPIDPYDRESMAEALLRFTSDAEMRKQYGDRTLAVAPQFDWNEVSRKRLEQLRTAFD
jgi:glycosyltransferase involved in cell wall biosynthesis